MFNSLNTKINCPRSASVEIARSISRLRTISINLVQSSGCHCQLPSWITCKHLSGETSEHREPRSSGANIVQRYNKNTNFLLVYMCAHVCVCVCICVHVHVCIVCFWCVLSVFVLFLGEMQRIAFRLLLSWSCVSVCVCVCVPR